MLLFNCARYSLRETRYLFRSGCGRCRAGTVRCVRLVAADGSVVFCGFVVAGDVVVSDFVLLGGSSDADFGAITTA